ncbi:bifunctional DNA primase/polymerase [Streptomyces sp. FXJ1.172]|uniref:bifunctional DNA primase/polymerase n=1 Tax=Streptomyces sp. FXJ1.172 TaxID=710705 RepID=UPI0007CF4B9F|nr:bifunctional DNA primase/polymerase [Streptomyces sp. FXJ1.172]WEO95302.1 bifunctional DNA primase/polymerase [Streptomyces sp. FXJ1.172]
MTQPRPHDQLVSALDAASRGWHVFPLIPGDKRPAVRDWENRATTDRERITRCWTHAPYNVGIAAGPSRLVVIDLDTPKTPDDTPPAAWTQPGVSDGADVLAVLCERHGQPFPCDTHTVRTCRGGLHLYFTAPTCGESLRNTAGDKGNGLGWKIDTRTAGGYVVAAGSTAMGRPYATVHHAPVAPLPDWLATLLRPAPLPPQRPVTVPLTTRDRRGKFLTAALNGELARVTGSGAHEHNNALYHASVALGQLVAGGELDAQAVTEKLTEAALSVGQGEREARRTIASGLRAGANRPRQVAA